ncbi:MAG: TM2 domain-containing protein [Clostridia bacterium]|nr:TM2 domain-containing protein [Clostridia bacterium]
MFCPNCGSSVEDTFHNCPNCGAPLGNNQNEGPIQENQGYTVQNDGYTAQNQGYTTQTYTQPNNFQGATPNGAKSKVVGGLLGILLGAFGAHNFYLGYTGKAIAQLLITLLSCFILSPISYIWGLIEGIMILTGSIATDAKGNQLVD